MHVGPAGNRYAWVDAWAHLDDQEHLQTSWAHHALAVTRDGHVVGFHPVDGRVVVLTPTGEVVRSFDCGVVEGHGVAIVEEDDVEYLWVADIGMRAVPTPSAKIGYENYVRDPDGTTMVTMPDGEDVEMPVPCGRVLKVHLDDGEVVTVLPKPDHELYRELPYIPTAVAGMPDGTVWVADGYGANALHRFSPDGRLLRTLTGEESGVGRLACPHGMLLDRRRREPELYVADRENLRLLVFDVEGTFRREVARGELARPSALATHGELLAVAELCARVALLDLDDRVVGHLGANDAVVGSAGWPNALDGERFVRPTTLEAGRFNSPHGLAIDSGGNLYVTEWLIGGRYTKLEPTPDA